MQARELTPQEIADGSRGISERQLTATEVQARGRHAADGTALKCEDKFAQPPGLGCHGCNRFGQADAEIDDGPVP
jgi:hypothetical protein